MTCPGCGYCWEDREASIMAQALLLLESEGKNLASPAPSIDQAKELEAVKDRALSLYSQNQTLREKVKDLEERNLFLTSLTAKRRE